MCHDWPLRAQPLTTYLRSMITLPSTELVKWVHALSKCALLHISTHKSHIATATISVDKFPFSMDRQFSFFSLRMGFSCHFFHWNYIFGFVAAMPFLKATIGSDTTIRDFTANCRLGRLLHFYAAIVWSNLHRDISMRFESRRDIISNGTFGIRNHYQGVTLVRLPILKVSVDHRRGSQRTTIPQVHSSCS